MQLGVQREGAAHLRDQLTLRLLKNHDTAATADYLMVFTATTRQPPARPRQIENYFLMAFYDDERFRLLKALDQEIIVFR